jgi:transposase-like protein
LKEKGSSGTLQVEPGSEAKMNPQEQFCPNMECSARGKVGEGNITIHSPKEGRFKCKQCGKTFSRTTGTPLYGLKKASDVFVMVVTLLAYGCPVQAIVAAFGLDERTVKEWFMRSGQHCQQVHEHFMDKTVLDLGQVQADEIKVKKQRGTVWMAMALMVRTRLWLGGVVGEKRDKSLIRELAGQVRQWALCRPILVAVDGLAAYLKAFREAFRSPYKGAKGGRPRLYVWEEVAIVQVIKRKVQDSLTIERRVAHGCTALVERLIVASQTTGTINTAFIERLNATFRQRLACLVRRGRALARQVETLEAGMFLVGCVYNFCTHHHSLRLKLWITERHLHWVPRTPAVAAQLTDHCWSVKELLMFKLPISPFLPPKRRGRPSKLALAAATS